MEVLFVSSPCITKGWLVRQVSGSAQRILYVDSYVFPAGASGSPSSDSIGYGITASRAIRHQLSGRGYDVIRTSSYMSSQAHDANLSSHSQWILDTYQALLKCISDRTPDLIFIFHIFQAFPAEIRRMLLDLRLRVPLIGYTHGSHWDYTDLYRFENYQGLEVADLGNLCALDRVLVASRYMKQTLHANISSLNSELGKAIDDKVRVVGLPIDTQAIDASRTDQEYARTTIVYNHAPIASKDPVLFLHVIAKVLAARDVDVVFTRKLPSHGPVKEMALEVAERYPGHVHFGNDLSIEDYYRCLWMADIQVSTALHESLGIATLEAMYTGNCCIVPRIGSYPELCDNDEGMLYDRTAQQLVPRLCSAIDSAEQRLRRCGRTPNLALRFSPKRVGDSINAVIVELLAASERGPQ